MGKKDIPESIRLKLHEHPGVYFGGWGQYGKKHFVGMRQGEDGNIMVVGGNGSGKSSCIILPTLHTWAGTFVALDVKGELSDNYCGYNARPTIIFDPKWVNTPSYDPFYWLEKDEEANLASNIQSMANALIPKSQDDCQPFWIDTARGVLAAALLFYWKAGLSFSETICMLLSMSVCDLYKELGKSRDVLVSFLLGQISELGEKATASIDRELRNHLVIFASDTYIAHAFRGSREEATTFFWDTVESNNIFLRIPEDKVDLWKPAVNLMFTQCIQYLERRPERNSFGGWSGEQILLVMDEFPRIGKLENITSALATLRSKRVNICLAIQSVAQMDQIYGEYERRVIFDNCQYLAILRANDAETQRYLAALIGTKSRPRESNSTNWNPNMLVTGYGQQISEDRDWTVQPYKMATLKEILLLTPYGFYKVEKNYWNWNSCRTWRNCSIWYKVNNILYSAMWCNDAMMLSPELRIKNAKFKLSKTQKQSSAGTETAVSEDDSSYAARMYWLVCTYVPEVAEAVGNSAENDARLDRLESILQALAGNPALLPQPMESI